ncbi:probable fatty acyl-CoA reductase 5, partial [Humulus lupulus]|uniref:probable fatty acyl-CoA reductase 5 n=1 Tax=Humulus lupulus TaxID=3486 RepID=UPI002B410B70
MELGNMMEYFENKTILITGGAGFIAKIFVEKILRTQPNVKKLYLLLRASDCKSAQQRIQTEVIDKELFRLLREKWGKEFDCFIWERVEAVAGDIADENLLGIKNANLREEMLKNIDIIVNCAATTDFYDRYDVSLAINTMGVLNILSFAKKCINLKMLLHLSTAYVCGEREGIIAEKGCEFGETLSETLTKLDFKIENELAAHKLSQLQKIEASEATINTTMKDFGIERLCLNQSIVITIPGWIEGLRTMDTLIAGFGKGKVPCFLGRPTYIIDMIPADMVVNSMIVAMVYGESGTIYQIGSSMRNPLYVSNIHNYAFHYFTKNPLIDKDENPIKVSKVTVLHH